MPNDSPPPNSYQQISLIPGVYNYCDRWCERCRFASRCRTFLATHVLEEALANGRDPVEALSELNPRDDSPGDEPMSPAARAEWETFLERANTPPTDAERAELSAAFERRDRWLAAHPLTSASRDYSMVALDLGLAAAALPAISQDPISAAALEAITRLACLIPAKVHRALCGLPQAALDDDDDDDEFGSYDGDGSAKVVRLAIEESREAWATLIGVRWSRPEGLPAVMVRRLSDLDAQVAKVFPRAMDFHRPGFDDGEDVSG